MNLSVAMHPTGIFDSNLKSKLIPQSGIYKSILKKENVFIAGLLLFAFILRIWGINFGLPYYYHFDETTYTGAALNLGAGQIGPQINPTGFTNILFGEYALYFIVGRLFGIFGSVSDFGNSYNLDPTRFLQLSRFTSSFFGTLNILVIYLLGKEVFNRFIGLLAALFLAAVFLHTRDSHFGVPDITMTFFVSFSIMFCVLANKRRRRFYLYLAAITGGYAVATKWSAFPIAIPVFLSLLLNVKALFERSLSVREYAKQCN